MIGWLEWVIGYGQGAGLDLMIYLFVFQWISAFTIIMTVIASKQWSMTRIILTALVWPLALIVLMVGKPVKAIRNRRDPQLALDQLVRRHRDESRPALEQDASIAFWRAQLTAESEVERECAVRMLTDVYAVPLEEPKPEPTGTENDPLDLSRYIAPGMNYDPAAAVGEANPVAVALAVREQIMAEMTSMVRDGVVPTDTALLHHQLAIIGNERAEDLPGMSPDWVSSSKWGSSAQYALGARIRREYREQAARTRL